MAPAKSSKIRAHLSLSFKITSHPRLAMNSNLKVLYLAAEAEPLVKVGGLGDVAGSLPAAILSGNLQPNLPFGCAIEVELCPASTLGRLQPYQGLSKDAHLVGGFWTAVAQCLQAAW